MVRKRMESMSWKMAVLAPIPRARVRTATRVKPGLRRRNRKAWRRARQSEVIASPWQYKTTGGPECHVKRPPKTAIYEVTVSLKEGRVGARTYICRGAP